MTIEQYVNKYNISYRELARRLEISAPFLIDLKNGRRKTISEKVGDKFKKVAPEIDIIKEQKIVYKIKGEWINGNKSWKFC